MPPRSRLVVVLLVLLGTVLVAPLSAQTDDQTGEIVKDVVVEGALVVDLSLLQANLRTRPGKPLDPALLDEDVRWLADEYGLLGDVVIDPGPVVRFVLKRVPSYEFVTIEGNERFNDATLFGVARLSKDGGASQDELVRARSLIKEHYLKKGHAFVEVTLRPSQRADGSRGQTIFVFEGPEVEVDDVVIEGLTAIDPSDAKDVMKSAPGFWSWLVGQDFVRADVDRDLVLLEELVRNLGYLDARVGLDGLVFSDDREEVVVHMVVDQGERYTVRSMRVEGNTAFGQDELLEGAALTVGGPLRERDRILTERAIRSLYGQHGYIDAKVRAEPVYDLDSPVVDMVWRIDEGGQKRVRDVLVRGNSGTRDAVVRRYLTLYPGDIVDTRELDYSEDALVSLQYFTDFSGLPRVRVSTEPTPDPALVDVVVDVDDASSGFYSFFVGAGSDSGIFGGVELDKRNFDISRASSSWTSFFKEFFGTGDAFHGGGQRLHLELQPGTRESLIDVLFEEPWLDESREDPWGLSVELYNRLRYFREYTRSQTGVGVFFSHRFNRETSISIGPRYELLDISNVDQAGADVVTGQVTDFAKAEGTAERRVLEGNLRYTKVDSLSEPTDGFMTRLSIESVGGPLGGDVDALRSTWSNEWFFPVTQDDDGNWVVFHPRFALAAVRPVGAEEDLPFYERVFAGGASGPLAVRGFDYRGIGPHQQIQNTPLGPVLLTDGGDSVGGRMAAVASLETLHPLVTQYNPYRDQEEILMKGVLFVDAGNLLEGAQLSDLGTDVRLSTGAGLRLRLPALGGLTMQLDYAFVLRDQPSDEQRRFSFELSRRF
ncbi:MAG: BamA/TamA family outer membrane protein [Planctomycetes bacterium]|nr:BamA/TamA family outer membrane protein [Planctomycetota bacterium]